MPRAFSISIQSETVLRRPALPCTAPASVITCACRASASVSVDLPASGWLITAKVRRRAASRVTSVMARASVWSVVEVTVSCIVEGCPEDAAGNPASLRAAASVGAHQAFAPRDVHGGADRDADGAHGQRDDHDVL